MNREAKNKKQGGCLCPFCDEEVMVTLAPFCKSCGVTLNYCTVCHVAVPPEKDACPSCGRPVAKKKVSSKK
jgi:hypothetical protein